MAGLSYYLHQPATTNGDAPLLLFLHGIGEGFANRDQVSAKHLFNQGPPKHLGAVPKDHPLRASFALIAPQLPDRETLWLSVVDEVKTLLQPFRAPNRKLYLMGFSKGGLGAFQVARKLGARALVTIDASPMDGKVADVVAEWVTPPALCPFWAIHTNYAEGERLRRVQDFNALLPASVHPDLEKAPSMGSSWRTLVNAPPGEGLADQQVARHGWICDQVTTARAPYAWLLQH